MNPVAHTILQQLGGNRFVVMTGAKQFGQTDTKLQFRLPRAKNGINFVEIELNGLDLYNVKFMRVQKFTFTVKAQSLDVYAENLAQVFENATGLYTHL